MGNVDDYYKMQRDRADVDKRRKRDGVDAYVAKARNGLAADLWSMETRLVRESGWLGL